MKSKKKRNKSNPQDFVKTDCVRLSFHQTDDISDMDIEIYRNLSYEQKEHYRELAINHPDYSHTQIMDIIASEFTNEERVMRNIVKYRFLMQGIGFDISISLCLSKKQKQILMKACENYFFNEIPFNRYQKSLLYRVRYKHHIFVSGLSKLAEPCSILDKILCF